MLYIFAFDRDRFFPQDIEEWELRSQG